MAAVPLPRLRVNPKLRDTVHACGVPGWQLSASIGFTHHSKFSRLINTESIPASPTNIQELERIADVVGFDRSQLFLDGDL